MARLSFKFGARSDQIGPCRIDGCAAGADLLASAVEIGLRLVQRNLILRGVDLEQRLTCLHFLVVRD